MQKLLVLALIAAHAVAQKCVPGTTDVLQISSTKDASALAKAIICPGVTIRAVVSGTVQPTNTITVGAKSKLIISASKALKPAVIDGQGTVQLFSVLAGGELSLQNVVLSKGFAAAEGGGILAAAGSAITIINSKLEGNVARRGAAIYTDGSVSIDQVR
jgi:predicted outer membrane repeat protein